MKPGLNCPRETLIMFEEFSYQRFASTPHAQMPALLSELRNKIYDRLTRVLAPHAKSDDAIRAFHDEVEKICEELARHGHVLGRLDYDGDVRFEHNSQYWGTHYREFAPNGLEIEFRPTQIRILWVVGPHDDAREGL
jgi:hypothetical protein